MTARVDNKKDVVVVYLDFTKAFEATTMNYRFLSNSWQGYDVQTQLISRSEASTVVVHPGGKSALVFQYQLPTQ